VRHKRDDSKCLDEKPAVFRIQNAQKYNAQCHITTRDTRSHIIACKCLLDMGIEKASGDGGGKDGGEVSLEGAREVAPAANAALELQRQRSNCTVALELQRQRSNYNTALELQRQRSNCTDGGAHVSAPRGCTCSVAPAAENRRRTGSAPDLSNVCMNTGFMLHPCCVTDVSYHCI